MSSLRYMLVLLVACDGAFGADDAEPDASPSGGACALTEGTLASGATTPSGCAILDRDTSVCDAARDAAGITGVYRHFSCRVTLTVAGAGVSAASDGRPDHASNYYASSDPCWESYTGAIQNPNSIAKKSYSMVFPSAPNTTSRTMSMSAVVGLAVNGVPIYGNFAAPGDDIFEESRTFDRCGGHPQMQGAYHHHAEPLSITYDDHRFVGVMRDGYPIYGRRDVDDTYPSLDVYGGHTSATPDSTTPVYHYHVNEQTSSTAGTAGEKQWFLTTGTYRGAPGSCTGC